MSNRKSKVSKNDSDAVVSRGFEPDREIKVWALDEKGALDFFGFSAYDKIVHVIKNAPETEREKEKYCAAAKCFAITDRVVEPSTDERVVLAELLRDAALLLREVRPLVADARTAHSDNWKHAYTDLMRRIKTATDKE